MTHNKHTQHPFASLLSADMLTHHETLHQIQLKDAMQRHHDYLAMRDWQNEQSRRKFNGETFER
jgi:hypothetical protein